MIHRIALSALCVALAAPAWAQGEVNVYSYREHKLIQPLLDAFTKDTEIKVNVISASSGLEQRIKTEARTRRPTCCSPSTSRGCRMPRTSASRSRSSPPWSTR
jgi:ABC-type glycerol-3-phosphate transport system substrate-binding protein